MADHIAATTRETVCPACGVVVCVSKRFRREALCVDCRLKRQQSGSRQQRERRRRDTKPKAVYDLDARDGLDKASPLCPKCGRQTWWRLDVREPRGRLCDGCSANNNRASARRSKRKARRASRA